MFRQIAEPASIVILPQVSEKIHAYSQSLSEVVFVLGGRDNIVLAAYRIANVDANPRHYFEFTAKQDLNVKKNLRAQNLRFMGYAHSHPNRHHFRYPSKSDFKYLPKTIQLICFPIENELKGWIFRETYKSTLSSSLKLICC